MLLTFVDGRFFATGATTYSYDPPESPKLRLEVEIEGFRTSAVLDTGAPYFICNPQVAAQINLSEIIGPETLDTRLGKVPGALFRGTLRFLAQEGDSIEIDATVFVPDSEVWQEQPSFLGLSDCLDRLRFAVDASTQSFYFGKP
jgi:hypothetical protein